MIDPSRKSFQVFFLFKYSNSMNHYMDYVTVCVLCSCVFRIPICFNETYYYFINVNKSHASSGK